MNRFSLRFVSCSARCTVYSVDVPLILITSYVKCTACCVWKKKEKEKKYSTSETNEKNDGSAWRRDPKGNSIKSDNKLAPLRGHYHGIIQLESKRDAFDPESVVLAGTVSSACACFRYATRIKMKVSETRCSCCAGPFQVILRLLSNTVFLFSFFFFLPLNLLNTLY